MKRAFFALAALTCASFAASFASAQTIYHAGPLEIKQPWIRAAPAGAGAAGGYVTITNHGDSDERLVGVSASFAGHSEVHEMAMSNGIMTMRHLEQGLPIPAGASVTLKPGSYHLMFMALQTRPKAGDTVAGTLIFDKAGAVPVDFSVEAMGARAPAHDGHHQPHPNQ